MRKSPPFKILPSRQGSYRRDGRHIVSGRLSFAWENLVMAIACGIEGKHEIRRGQNEPWYEISMTIEEAERALDPEDTFFGKRRVERARRFRARKGN